MILLQPGSGTAYATSVSVVSAAGVELPPAASLDPPPHAASRVAVTGRAGAGRQDLRMLSIGDLSLQGINGAARHHSKARDQYLGRKTAATDTKPRTGVESATTVDVCNSARTHGNEGQDVALGTAGRCMHGAKNNRVRQRAQPGCRRRSRRCLSRLNELAAM